MDIIVRDEEHECLGFSGAPKEHPPPERDCIFLKIYVLERTPIQSLVRKWKLCKPSLTAHIKHRWRMPHSPHLELHEAVPLPPSPIQRHCRPGVRQHHHTDFNQEGKRVQYYRTSHVKECLGSEGEPTALPRKRSRHRGQYSGSILTQRLLSFYNMSFLV